MQKEDRFFILGPFIRAYDMAKRLNVSEDFIIQLCLNSFVFAHKDDKMGWLISEDYNLPCVTEFKNVEDDINHKILRGEHAVSYVEECYSWTECLLENNEYVEFQNICIDEMIHKDDEGHLHLKYVILAEQYLQVTSWSNSLNQILHEVNHALPHAAHIIGVFNEELDAYVYAQKMLKEIDLMDAVTLKYCENYLMKEKNRLKLGV